MHWAPTKCKANEVMCSRSQARVPRTQGTSHQFPNTLSSSSWSRNSGFWQGFVILPFCWFYIHTEEKEIPHTFTLFRKNSKIKGGVRSCSRRPTFSPIQTTVNSLLDRLCPMPSRARNIRNRRPEISFTKSGPSRFVPLLEQAGFSELSFKT